MTREERLRAIAARFSERERRALDLDRDGGPRFERRGDCWWFGCAGCAGVRDMDTDDEEQALDALERHVGRLARLADFRRRLPATINTTD